MDTSRNSQPSPPRWGKHGQKLSRPARRRRKAAHATQRLHFVFSVKADATLTTLRQAAGGLAAPGSTRWVCACGWQGRAAELVPTPAGGLACPTCGGTGGLEGMPP